MKVKLNKKQPHLMKYQNLLKAMIWNASMMEERDEFSLMFEPSYKACLIHYQISENDLLLKIDTLEPEGTLWVRIIHKETDSSLLNIWV